MKKYILFIAILFSSFLFSDCGGPKSRIVVVVHKDKSIFVAGEPHVKYSSRGASLDYFIPGAIMALKTDYKILNQEGKSGKIYQISKDTILTEIETFDIEMNDTAIVNKFLIPGLDTE